MKAFTGKCDDLMPRIKSAFDELSADKDVMIVAGSGSMYSGKYCGLDGVSVVKALGIKAIVIDRYVKELNYDYLIAMKERLGDQLLGVLLNDIPPVFKEELDTLLHPFLESKGIKVLGKIPSDPLMGAIKVADLADRLGGRIITAQDKSERVVENFLIGTMQVENFMTHFRKSKKSAIIVGGDRSDVQLVALEGQCQCLVLTGNLYPNDIIMTRAEVLEVPIVVVRDDTFTVAKKMEAILSRHKLRDVIKIQHGSQLVSSIIDFPYMKDNLGI
jgi:BioD-like phosphotransacetylase family protein